MFPHLFFVKMVARKKIFSRWDWFVKMVARKKLFSRWDWFVRKGCCIFNWIVLCKSSEWTHLFHLIIGLWKSIICLIVITSKRLTASSSSLMPLTYPSLILLNKGQVAYRLTVFRAFKWKQHKLFIGLLTTLSTIWMLNNHCTVWIEIYVFYNIF